MPSPRNLLRGEGFSASHLELGDMAQSTESKNRAFCTSHGATLVPYHFPIGVQLDR